MFHAPIPPSFIHCPNETSRRANGIPTTTELIKNGMRNAPENKAENQRHSLTRLSYSIEQRAVVTSARRVSQVREPETKSQQSSSAR